MSFTKSLSALFSGNLVSKKELDSRNDDLLQKVKSLGERVDAQDILIKGQSELISNINRELTLQSESLKQLISQIDSDKSSHEGSIDFVKGGLEKLNSKIKDIRDTIETTNDKLKKVDVETKHNLRRIKDARSVAAGRDLLYYELIKTDLVEIELQKNN